MKQLIFFLFALWFLTANAAVKDTIPANIKHYSKEQFLKEFGTDETSQKMIRYYFYRNKNAKQSQYIFPTLTAGSIAYGFGLSAGTSGFSILIAGGAFLMAIGFFIISIQAFDNRRKYSPQKLYKQLKDYQAGNPLTKQLKRQIRHFNLQ